MSDTLGSKDLRRDNAGGSLTRRFFHWLFSWRMLRRGLLTLAALATLVGLAWAIENWRGHRAWEDYTLEMASRGERLDRASIIPPLPPDDQNFAMTPFLAPFFDYTRPPGRAQTTVWLDTNVPVRMKLKMLPMNNPPAASDWHLRQFVDLKAWQVPYRADTNFPSSPQPQAPGEDILVALGKFDPLIAELRSHSLRPYSQFKIHWDENFSALLPHLGVLKGISGGVRLRALAELSLGKTGAAASDVELGFRLAGAAQSEPFLISKLVRIAQIEAGIQPLWEGLARRQWSEGHLATFDQELAKIDLLAEYQRAMRSERLFAFEYLDLMRHNPRFYRELFMTMENPKSKSSSDSSPIPLIMPGGWFDQNKVQLGRLYQDYVYPMVDTKGQLISPSGCKRTAETVETNLRGFPPYHALAALLFPALAKSAERVAQTQTAVNQARIAIALERYRLRHGHFPDSLVMLAPDFISVLPHDLINGQPLKYRPADDGQFILYSVGWNEKDDGGEPGQTKSKPVGFDPLLGDWVWSYPKH